MTVTTFSEDILIFHHFFTFFNICFGIQIFLLIGQQCQEVEVPQELYFLPLGLVVDFSLPIPEHTPQEFDRIIKKLNSIKIIMYRRRTKSSRSSPRTWYFPAAPSNLHNIFHSQHLIAISFGILVLLNLVLIQDAIGKDINLKSVKLLQRDLLHLWQHFHLELTTRNQDKMGFSRKHLLHENL